LRAVWNATNQSFYDWGVAEADFGKALQAPSKDVTDQGNVHYETLPEITAVGAKMPWQFQAYKKVVRSQDGVLVAKEMVCSRPRILPAGCVTAGTTGCKATTRPSKERCCVRKRQLAAPVSGSAGYSTCTAEELLKQL
jgi:hypothetical protein